MAIFTKGDQPSASASATTVIATGAKIEGTFNFHCKLHVDGEIRGQIFSNSIITIGKSGALKGELKAKKLIVSGLYEGSADCESVEIIAGGKFLGKILAKDLLIESGSGFEGESKIKGSNEKTVSATTPDKAKA